MRAIRRGDMKAKLKSALRALDRGFEAVLCGACLCVMASCVMVQVLLRYLFAAAAPWAEEVAVYAMVGAVYMGACLAIRDRAHIRIMLLHNLLPPKARLVLLAIADFLLLIFLGVWLTQSTELVATFFRFAEISPGLGIDQKWPQATVPFCVALMMARLVQVYWRQFKGIAQEPHSEPTI